MCYYCDHLIRRNRKIVRKCCYVFKFACGLCMWLNFLIYMYIISVFIISLQRPTKSASNENVAVDIEAFLEVYRKNISFKERNLLINWNTSKEIIPYNKIGCKLIICKPNLLHKTSLISQTKCAHYYIVVILTTSNIYDFNRRMLIRNTWGNDRNLKKHRWKIFFLVGLTYQNETMQTLSCESEMFDDIIYGDIHEHLNNLTAKIQMGFEWVLTYCNFKYLLKTDDDIFVNVPILFQFLQDKHTERTKLYAGHVQFEARVHRTGKYAVSKKEYWKKVYPRYCSGGGFVLSTDVVMKMTAHFDDIKPLRISDAYVGELALRSGVDSFHDDRFFMFQDESKCIYNENVILYHPVKTKKCMLYLHVKNLVLIKYMDNIS